MQPFHQEGTNRKLLQRSAREETEGGCIGGLAVHRRARVLRHDGGKVIRMCSQITSQSKTEKEGGKVIPSLRGLGAGRMFGVDAE